MIKTINDWLCKLLKLDMDKSFISNYKGEWNRFCNYYKPRKRNITKEEFDNEKNAESQLPTQVKLGKDFGHLYELYLKYKFIPDNRFFISLDEEFVTTIKKVHEILSINPYPQSKDNDPDLAYDLRWRAIILFEYLEELTLKPFRFIGIMIFRFTLFVSVPLGILITIFNGIKNLI